MAHGYAAAIAIASAALLAACAPQLAAPAPGTASIAGVVRLVPRDGAPTASAGGAYGDRRLRDVRLFDYSKPGSSVVYLDAGTRPGGRVEVTVEQAVAGPRLVPKLAVVGAGGEVAIANRTDAAVALSIPALDRVAPIAAGEELVVHAERAGALEIFLLGAEEPAQVWVSPGPWTRPDASGRFAFTGLPPGRVTVRAWHPRLPAAAVDVDLRADAITSVELEIGVGRGEGSHDSH